MNYDKISVVIICKNAENTIGQAIQSVRAITNDIVVVDTGSHDHTLKIIKTLPVRLVETSWLGYGATKNLGNKLAKNKWILSLDADEYIDAELIKALLPVDLSNAAVVFSFKRLNYLDKVPVKHGEWGRDVITRVFNSTGVDWDTTLVHEQLVAPFFLKKILLPGCIHHLTSTDIATYKDKLTKYALLMAKKYQVEGKKAYWHKLYLSPVASFLNNYIIRKGFLDGKKGYQVALASAIYTFEKYNKLKQLTSVKNL